jgi:galactose mutarotase-like enzyme
VGRLIRLAGGAGETGVVVEFDADDGARITTLYAAGREWLSASPPRNPLLGFTASGAGGWDEVAPTVAPCTLPDGTALPDHGDAWRQPWTVLEVGASTATVAVSLRSLPIRLTRTVTVHESGLRAEYSASTMSREGVPLHWSAHPLFAAPAGTRIEVETDAFVGEYPVAGASLPAPRDGSIDAVDAVDQALKLYAATTGLERARVVHPDGQALTMRWDAAALPHLGLYWDAGVFSNEPVVAIEPSTGCRDAASAAFDTLPLVRAGRPLRWWLEIHVEPRHPDTF